MGKIVLILGLVSFYLYAEELSIQKQSVEKNCLNCHQQQQIPSSLIHKRYLMKYSTAKRMEEAIFTYLKHPDRDHSIMPSAFFSKFPMKEAATVDDNSLRKYIQNYIKTFDIKKKLVLEK